MLHPASHPVLDESSLKGTGHILELAHAAGAGDLVIALISGGGSALMELPVDGVSLADFQAFTQIMLRCGATINELNIIRKHLSQVKGGQLARAVAPAQLLTLILSDVVGNPLDIIASGPTVPDSSTFADAWTIVRQYKLQEKLPTSITRHLQAGLSGEIPDTPKPGDPAFAHTANVLVGSNILAAQAALAAATDAGFHAQLLSTYVEGEAREVAKVCAALGREILSSGNPQPRPACLVLGGETTVTVQGAGTGGRNQELALAAALALQNVPDVLVVSLATDGGDGPTDAAGGMVDGQTVARGKAQRLNATDFLARNDAYPFLTATQDLLQTGPTQTNVNDLMFVFVF